MLARAVLLGALLLSVTGCGYTLGNRWPDSIHTIAVPIFDNKTFPLRRDVEYELTSALQKEIQLRTPLRLVADVDDANLVVYGSVVGFQERLLAEGRRDQKLESSIRVVVHMTIEDLVNRTRRREVVEEHEPFSVSAGETVDDARRRALQNLAETLLLRIESW